MPTFYVKLYAKTYGECLIEANSEKEAIEIANNIDIYDTHEETECYDIEFMQELNQNQLELYDLPILEQTKDGYKVK